ncbi:ribonuclease H-like domain-containing protein [Xylaria arbuscula]|nr:ribonuclease H-like domain-containing protein [Xylaria arbuscula]
MATWHGPGGRNRPAGGGGGGGGGGGSSYRKPAEVFSPSGRAPVPDLRVTELENSLLAGAKNAGLSPDLGFPIRPSYGTNGPELVLWANYYTLEASKKLVVYQYEVSVKPGAVGRKLGHIIRLFLQSPNLRGHRDDVVTDFREILISRLEIPNQVVKLPYRAEGEDEPRQNACEYTITLERKKAISVSDLIKYLTSPDLKSQYEHKSPIVQALNILINHHAKSSNRIATIGTSKKFSLDNAETYELGAGLQAIRGFFTSVRPATGRLLLNVNVTHAAFYEAAPLDQLIKRFMTQNDRFRLKSFLKGLRITTNHLEERRNRNGERIIRVKTIYNLATKKDGYDKNDQTSLEHPPRVRETGAGAKGVEFWLEDNGNKKKQGKSAPAGRYISVYDYFQQKYQKKIADPSLPVVNVGTQTNPSYLPAQVCVALSGQPAKRQLSSSQTQKMIQFAVRPPVDNAKSIVSKGLSTAGISTSPTSPQLISFGVTVSPNLITVKGRLLGAPKVSYSQNKQAPVMNGSWNMVPRGSPALQFISSTGLPNWSCLYISMPGLYPIAETFDKTKLITLLKSFGSVLKSTGIKFNAPAPLDMVELRETDDVALDTKFKHMVEKQNVDFLFVILPSSPIPLYSRIKQLADVKYGIQTICSVGSKIANERGQDQYFRNEALKVNLKLGGTNQLVEPERLGLIADGKTMVVGIDVTHPSPSSSDAAPSIGAMVASIDSKLSQWPGILNKQEKRRQEMVSDLITMLKSRLQLWRNKGKHPAYPENILIYRDGVSEGQYSTVLQEELPLLRKACNQLYPASDQKKHLPRMTMVIVGKRHHTRFYPTKPSDVDNSGNSKAGTVVDRGVTEARSFDFYLQSHAAIKGTARPAHYFVIFDEIFRDVKKTFKGQSVADELQMITQSLCYTYGPATKAISYCAPAYYADRLCERARHYYYREYEGLTNSSAESEAGDDAEVGVEIHGNLKDTMFYA